MRWGIGLVDRDDRPEGCDEVLDAVVLVEARREVVGQVRVFPKQGRAV